MASDLKKIDLLIQYSLLVAGEEDDLSCRQLGPIHLIKYVYLADLFYADRNQGNTFTGADWKFYKFGPWSQVVYSQIDPALAAIMANKLCFESNYGDTDINRWNLRNSQLLDCKSEELPASITLKLKNNIHKYLKDTPSLLDYVYKTRPMLNAAPNNRLDFRTEHDELENKEKKSTDLDVKPISNRKQKTLEEKMAFLRKEFRKRKTEQSTLISPTRPPRYDKVFSDGVSWLEELAGNQFSSKTLVAKFSKEVWTSKTRKGEDVS